MFERAPRWLGNGSLPPLVRRYRLLLRGADDLLEAALDLRLGAVAVEYRGTKALELADAIGGRGMGREDRRRIAVAVRLRKHLQDSDESVRIVAAARGDHD